MDNQRKVGIYEKYIKRIIDICCALLAFVFFGWLYVILAVLVRFKLGKPVLFKQERVGKNEKVFTLIKFRSMTDKKDENGELLPDSERLTSFGKKLRSTSLDELPEAINILEGTLSVVGPRPLPTAYLDYYNDQERHRHDVVPGLTGLAQVNGRTAVDWEKRFSYDLEYIKNISFKNDLKIVLLTVKKVFAREDIVEAGCQGDFDEFRRKQWSEHDERNRK